MSEWLPAAVAFFASILTFFSGFGLGTLLLPAFALFYPVEVAVGLTAVVHLTNNLFKFGMLYRHASWTLVWRFGVPAMLAAVLGAWLLAQLSGLTPLASYSTPFGGAEIRWTGLVIGLLLLLFALQELKSDALSRVIPTRSLPIGGLLSGFFGGLSGHQGALRSVFLLHTGIDRHTYVGTGVAIACMIDLARITTYAGSSGLDVDWRIVLWPVLAAIAGAVIGRVLLEKITLGMIQKIVAVLLIATGAGMMAGLI